MKWEYYWIPLLEKLPEGMISFKQLQNGGISSQGIAKSKMYGLIVKLGRGRYKKTTKYYQVRDEYYELFPNEKPKEDFCVVNDEISFGMQLSEEQRTANIGDDCCNSTSIAFCGSEYLSTFYNYVKNKQYDMAYFWLDNVLNNEDMCRKGNFNNKTYCILLEKILGIPISESKYKNMSFRTKKNLPKNRKHLELYLEFIKLVEAFDFENAYFSLEKYLDFNPYLLKHGMEAKTFMYLICEIVDKPIFSYSNLIESSNQKDWIAHLNKCVDDYFSSENHDDKSNFKKIVRILNKINEVGSSKLVNSIQIQGLLRWGEKVKETKMIPYRFVSLDESDDVIKKFKKSIDSSAYTYAFKYVGKCLCYYPNDELLKMYAKILVRLIRTHIPKVVVDLDDNIVKELINNHEFDKLMSIFSVIGKDNLNSKYRVLYDKVEFLVKLKVVNETPEIKDYKYSFNDSAIEFLSQGERQLINKSICKIRIKNK